MRSWERVLGTHASLLSPAPPSRAELQLHLPANQLQAVEGGEVVLPAWYTLHAEVSSAQPGEVPFVMWFFKDKEKEDQVREERLSASGKLRPAGVVSKELVGVGGVEREWGPGKEFQGRAEVFTGSVFVLIWETSQTIIFCRLSLKIQHTKYCKSGEAFYLVMGVERRREKMEVEDWETLRGGNTHDL